MRSARAIASSNAARRVVAVSGSTAPHQIAVDSAHESAPGACCGLVEVLEGPLHGGADPGLERFECVLGLVCSGPLDQSKRCPYPEPPCMDLISVDEVEAACRQRLERPA